MMIIAGFAGAGKTYFCKNNRNAIDFIVMPFKYSNFYEVSKNLLEEEDIKAHEDLEFVIGWDEYYYFALRDTMQRFSDETIVIPTVASILERLRKDEIPVTVIYPNIEDKKEYEKRYRNRGNSDAFMEIFLERWKKWISAIQKMEPEQAIQLSTDEYLSDVIDSMPYDENKIIIDKETYIYDTYFKNGLAKEFAETPIGKLMEGLNIYGTKYF